MKRLLVTTAMICVSTLAAQAQANRNNNDCDLLIVAVNDGKIPASVVSLDQAKGYKRDGKDTVCRKLVADNNVKTGSDAAQIKVQQPAANIQVQQPTADVRVRQAEPQVSVSQGQPEITVHQPAPTVRIDIPQPVVTVRIPKPDVNVAQAKPQVSVSQAQPKVSVVQPQDNDKVSVTGTQQQAKVDYEQSGQQPKIRFEREKANIIVNQPNDQPKVNVVREGEDGNNTAMQGLQQDDTNDHSDASRSTAANTTAMVKAGQSELTVSRLTSMKLYNGQSNVLGDVEYVTRDGNGKNSIVIGRGGFLGLGERQIAVPLDQVSFDGDRLVTHDVTDEQLKAMPTWNKGSSTELKGDQKVMLSSRS